MIAFRKNTILKQLRNKHTKKTTKNFSHLHKQQPQVNVPHVKPVDHFTTNKFSKQQHLQVPKPERPLQFFTKSLAIVTMLSTYQNVSFAKFSMFESLKHLISD